MLARSNKKFLLILIFFQCFGLTTSQSNMQACRNNGVKIITRQKLQPYALQYECLCPYSYYGQSCQNIREIFCLISNQKIVEYTPKQQGDEYKSDVQLSFQIQCFLKKFHYSMYDYYINKNMQNNFHKLPLSEQQIKKDWEKSNYYIDPDFQVVWANSTALFNSDGKIKRNQSTTNMTDQQILNSYPHYQFNKTTQFFGFPLYNAQIKYQLNVQQFGSTRGYYKVGQPSVRYQKVNISTINGIQTKYVGRFNTRIKKQWQEYKVTRLELIISMFYGEQGKNYGKIYHRMGMNSAKWLIYDPNFTRGKRMNINKFKISANLLVILSFFGILILMWGAKQGVKVYKRWKQKKSLFFVEQQQEQLQGLQTINSDSSIKKVNKRQN